MANNTRTGKKKEKKGSTPREISSADPQNPKKKKTNKTTQTTPKEILNYRSLRYGQVTGILPGQYLTENSVTGHINAMCIQQNIGRIVR